MKRKARSKSPFAVDWPRHSAFASVPPPPAHEEERIRRNVACVNCRNSKVRCKTSPVAGQQCQRCAKLSISCVVDKSHKRVTKKSKLEQLEQELLSIKQAVIPNGTINTTWSPPSPRVTQAHLPEPINAMAASRAAPPQVPTPLSDAPRTGSLARPSSEKPTRSGPAESRLIASQTVPGEDVDFYFDKYLQFYHPYLPVLRRTDPNDCFAANPTLFWTIIYISCRRFCRNEDLYIALVEDLSRTPWIMLSTANSTIESIHAMLLLCLWPLPTIRLLSDPCPTLMNIAMTACMQLGMHKGKGACPEFCAGVRQNAKCKDEEASFTWLASCMIANQSAVSAGIVPPSIQYDDRRCKANLESTEWADLIAFFDLQKWLNRFHTAMATEMAAHDTTSEAVVSQWEYEFDVIKPSLIRYDTDITRLALLAARLEIQSYYLLTPTTPLPLSLVTRATALFHTARTYITTLTTLDSQSNHLRHHPQWSFRTLLSAATIIISALQQQTTCCPTLSDGEASEIAKQAFSAVARCSIREGDMAQRISFFMETFWSLRARWPRAELPTNSWRERLAVGVTFGTLKRFKIALIDAKKITDDTNKGADALQPEQSTTTGTTPRQEQAADNPDPFLGVDWSVFMDDFGWGGEESIFMGLP